MKIRLLFLTLGLALIASSGLRAQDPKPAPAAKVEKPETELEKTMGKMNKAWRQVRKATKEGKLTPADAALVAAVRQGAEEASKLTPALEAEKPAAERAKFQADYQAQLKKLVTTLTQLEAALTANDIPAATKLVADAGALIKGGHKEFRKPEENEHH